MSSKFDQGEAQLYKRELSYRKLAVLLLLIGVLILRINRPSVIVEAPKPDKSIVTLSPWDTLPNWASSDLGAYISVEQKNRTYLSRGHEAVLRWIASKSSRWKYLPLGRTEAARVLLDRTSPSPGQCFPVKPYESKIIVSFPSGIYLSGAILVLESPKPMTTPSSEPYKFTVSDDQGLLLGYYTVESKSSIHMFDLRSPVPTVQSELEYYTEDNNSDSRPVYSLTIEIQKNHGSHYTCLHRIRVYAKSCVDRSSLYCAKMFQ